MHLEPHFNVWQKSPMPGPSTARVSRRLEWTPGLFTLVLDLEATFTAGQFFNLSLPIGQENVRRSYSAASAPGESLEFFISEVPGGSLTPSLGSLREGDPLSVDEQGLGFFTLDEVPPSEELWMVATGTGVGPYISMLRQGSVFERFERIILVQGVRRPEELAYSKELQALSKVQSKFRHVPTLSGDAPARERTLSGRITNVWDSGALESAAGDFGERSHMLLCGNPQMITDMVQRLKERGFEKHRRRKAGHFNFEKYW